jgi:hypothetical protein
VRVSRRNPNKRTFANGAISNETNAVPLTASLILCQYCDHANPADANFCIGCGAQLHLVPCPTCGAVNPKTSKSCYQCQGELRESTEILLARVPASPPEEAAGSTAISTNYSPEPPVPQRQPIYVIVIIFLAFAAAAFFAYQQRSAVSTKTTSTETPTKNTAANPVEASPANASAGTINKAPIVAAPLVPQSPAPTPAASVSNPKNQTAALPIETKSAITSQPQAPVRQTAPPPSALRAGTRQHSTTNDAAEKKSPPLGPCTEGVAALGLCTPLPTKGNK